MSKNDELVALAKANGAPEWLLDFMRRYPYVIPSTPCYITVAFRQHLPKEVWGV